MARRKADHHGTKDTRGRKVQEEGEEGGEEGSEEEEGEEQGSAVEHVESRRKVTQRREESREGGEEGLGQDRRRLTPLADAAKLLRDVHKLTPNIIIGLSGGKDSLVTLDMCVREFGASNVSAFFMYLVKDLRCVETTVRWCERHYKIEVHRLPHWLLGLAYKNATYMPHRSGTEKWRDMRLVDVEQLARKKTGFEWIANGHRMADSIERVGMLNRIDGFDEVGRRVYPLWRWNEASVMAYLRARKIPPPPKLTILKRAMTGVSFQEDVLLAIRDKFPDDFKRILEVFPYVEARLARYELQKNSWKQKTYIDKFRTSLRGR
jgi:hypothetical protein